VIAGPTTTADNENKAVKTAMAMAGARQVENLRYALLSSGIEKMSPIRKKSAFPPAPTTNAAPAISPM